MRRISLTFCPKQDKAASAPAVCASAGIWKSANGRGV